MPIPKELGSTQEVSVDFKMTTTPFALVNMSITYLLVHLVQIDAILKNKFTYSLTNSCSKKMKTLTSDKGKNRKRREDKKSCRSSRQQASRWKRLRSLWRITIRRMFLLYDLYFRNYYNYAQKISNIHQDSAQVTYTLRHHQESLRFASPHSDTLGVKPNASS